MRWMQWDPYICVSMVHKFIGFELNFLTGGCVHLYLLAEVLAHATHRSIVRQRRVYIRRRVGLLRCGR